MCFVVLDRLFLPLFPPQNTHTEQTPFHKSPHMHWQSPFASWSPRVLPESIMFESLWWMLWGKVWFTQKQLPNLWCNHYLQWNIVKHHLELLKRQRLFYRTLPYCTIFVLTIETKHQNLCTKNMLFFLLL